MTRFDLASDLATVLDRYGIDPTSVDGVLDSLESVGLLDHLPEDDNDWLDSLEAVGFLDRLPEDDQIEAGR